MGVFSTGAMCALGPTILKNRQLVPAFFGHFSTVRKKKLWVLSKNLINTQHPQYQNPKYSTVAHTWGSLDPPHILQATETCRVHTKRHIILTGL